MKAKLFKILQTSASLALLTCLTSYTASAGNQYFDENGATAGYGITAGTTYSWEGTNWATVTGGAATTVNWISGSFAEFLSPSSAAANYTVNLTSNETFAGFISVTGVTINITNAPGVGLSITPNASQASQNGFSWVTQGCLPEGATVNIYAPIGGTGGVEEEAGGGNLNLYGSNSFTGGFLAVSSSTFIGYNNNNSFGAGQMGFETTFGIMNNTGPTTVNIPNPVQFIGNAIGLNFIGNSCTMSGTFYLGGSTTANIRNNGASGSVVTLAGALNAATGNVNFSGANGGIILLTAANTYAATTSIGVSGDAAITLEIGATGFVASTIITNDGILKLDSAFCLQTNATLQLPASPANNSVNLNFSGSQSLAAILMGGVPLAGGTRGAVGSSAQNQSAAFTGSGILSLPAAPAIISQPQPVATFPGGSPTFSVTANGAQPLFYQWLSNSIPISGANSSSFQLFQVTSNFAAGYSVVVSNAVGFTNSVTVQLTVLASNAYTSAVVGDSPIAYWRLDETNGSIALDSVGGNNGTYHNVSLGQQGFSVTDPDTAIGVPANGTPIGSVIISNNLSLSTFNFLGFGTPFTLEAWALSTNFSSVQRMLSTLGNGNGWGFGIKDTGDLRFTEGSKQDADISLGTNLVAGVWYQFDLVCDGSSYIFYLNGNQIGSPVASLGFGFAETQPLSIGADPAAYSGGPEQFYGNIDEVAIYNANLSGGQILNHYTNRFGVLGIPIVSNSIATPPTNYVSLSTVIQSQAFGQALSYQWFQSPNTMLNGQTNATLTISPLTSPGTSNYFVQVSNPAGSSNSPVTTITVLAIPTNASQLNLTGGLVLHLPFDGNDNDISGLNHNGTNVGSPTFVPGIIGADALSYSTDTNASSYNYVTLGEVSDLKFSSNIDFTVSYWIQEPNGSTFTNLPFFGDTIGSTTGAGGFAFAPYDSNNITGGWQWTVGSVSSPNAFTSFPDANVINDGNWHNLVHVANRSGNLTTYLDGQQVDSQAIFFVGNINNTNVANIGQDPTGKYAATASAFIDDLGVWRRQLTQLEVSGLYLGGKSNNISFAPAVASTTHTTLTITNVSGQLQVIWSGGGNLQATTNILGTFTNVPNATSPYNVPNPQGSATFYRVHP